MKVYRIDGLKLSSPTFSVYLSSLPNILFCSYFAMLSGVFGLDYLYIIIYRCFVNKRSSII
jgi:hypothetical protein